MTKAQHTPGPWLTKGAMSNFDKGKESIFVVNGKGDTVQIAQTSKVLNGSITRANARLIASAPDLLNEAKANAKFLEQLAIHLDCSDMPGQAGNCTVRAKATRAAIARATGEAL